MKLPPMLLGSNPLPPSNIALIQQAVGTGIGSAEGLLTNTLSGNSLVALISHVSTDTINVVQTANENLSLLLSKTVAGVTIEIWGVSGIVGGADSDTLDVFMTLGTSRVSINAS